MNYFLTLVCSFIFFQNSDLDWTRKNYKNAVFDENLCKTMIQDLDHSSKNDIELAYLGAMQTIWAKHTGNPFEKLKTFKKGKANIEKAVSQNKDNIEIRFVRYSIQKNTPSFLGYKNNIKTDEIFLRNHIHDVKNVTLKNMIIKTLNTNDDS